jgi:hypothetical protein
MRQKLRLLALAGLIVVGSCATEPIGGAFELTEFDISGPGTHDSGTWQIEVANSGDLPHTLVITDSSGHVVNATELILPGEVSTLDVTLAEGRYVFTCRIVAQTDTGEIVDHFEAGMNETIDVFG